MVSKGFLLGVIKSQDCVVKSQTKILDWTKLKVFEVDK